MSWVDDPEMYAKVSARRSQTEADDALKSFVTELRALREKYRIAEVVCGLQVYLDDGKAGFGMATFGDGMRHELLAARVFGQVSAERKDAVQRALRGNEEEE